MDLYRRLELWATMICLAVLAHLGSSPFVNCTATSDQEYEDYTFHPCIRPCTLHAAPMKCVYNFSLEYYTSMGKECSNCPSDVTDCFRRGCVPADGNSRVIMVVNKQLPGPAIHVCQGDMVIARVTNNLLGTEGTTIHWHSQLQRDYQYMDGTSRVTQCNIPVSTSLSPQVCQGDMVIARVTNNLLGTEGTTIHWHGQLQRDYQYMDGTSRVTQCHIPVSTSFEYRFPANTAGSHLWHDHSGPARSEGIFGALVVRQPPELEAHLGLYDLDLPEHTMVVMDWMSKPASEIYTREKTGRGFTRQTTILVNGLRVQEEFFQLHPSNRSGRAFLPMATFTVQQGFRYRFRLISNGVNECPIQVSVDDHTLTVIASDGEPFVKVDVDSLYLHSGERYDLVLTANQEVGNYWIRFQGTEFGCGGPKAYGAAILSYVGAPDDYPNELFTSYEDATRPGKSLNKWNVQASPNNVLLTNLQGLDVNREALKPVPDRKLYLKMRMSAVFSHSLGNVWLNQINNIRLLQPPSPPLTQLQDLDEGIFCDEDTLEDVNCTEVLCECVYRVKVLLGDVVELVVVDEGIEAVTTHPMHLHGYKFYVVGIGKLGDNTTVEEVKRLDQETKLPRNLATPVAKDTVAVNNGGYVIMRWHATNPGFWLFHCHTEFHLLEGQGLIFQVGGATDMPPVPARFPRCGDWRFRGYEDHSMRGYKTVSASAAIRPGIWTVVMVLILLETI